MIAQKTVLILGAGASTDYGFPSGKGLLFKVIHDLDNRNTLLRQWLTQFNFTDDLQGAFQYALINSSRPSIDALLEQRWDLVGIGRHAIAISLIPCEQETFLIRTERERWYEYLLNMMDSRMRDFGEYQLSIITFNYDRSLEYFLFLSLKASYALKDEQAAALVKKIPIIHVYGKLAEPDFLDPNGRAYTPLLTKDTIQNSASNINIMFEADPNGELEKANELINSADLCAFLGFGYHRTNIERLAMTPWQGRQSLALYGTALGKAPGEIARIKRWFGREDISLYPGGILDFMKDAPLFDDASH